MTKWLRLLLLFSILDFFNCLKIKLSSTEIVKAVNSRKAEWIEVEVLIEHLILSGPYSVLGGLIGLETSIDFRKIVVEKCCFMRKEIILNIFEEFNNGEMSEEQFRNVLSADCIAKWHTKVFRDLSDLEMIKMLPVNPLESKDFPANRMPEKDFMKLLESAWNSEKRESIIWNRWTSTIMPGQYPAIFNDPLWRTTTLWQSVNFRNFLTIKETQTVPRRNLIHFIGLKAEMNLESFSIEELIHRCYTLISFVKLGEIEAGKVSETDHLSKGISQAIVAEIVKLFARINSRIREIDEQTAERVYNLFDYIVSEPSIQQQTDPNDFFVNFLDDSSSIEFGDRLLEIICILIKQIDLIKPDNLVQFLAEFFKRKPSIDSVVFLLRFFKENIKFSNEEISSAWREHLTANPKYLIEIYKSPTAKKYLPSGLFHVIPLKKRYYQNLKNRFIYFQRRPGATFELELPNNRLINDLAKFLEFVAMFAWYNVNINQLIIIKDIKMMYRTVTFEPVLDLYFRLFMKQKQFYSVKSTEGSRPVIRILPLFPVELWYQLGHLITRAVLLRMKLPFIIDFEFFEAALNPDESRSGVVSEITAIVEKSTDFLRDLYIELNNERYLWTEYTLDSKLKFLYHDLESVRLYGNSQRSESEPSPETEDLMYSESIKQGLNSFANGLRSGMNIADFTIEEAHKLIFHIE